MMISFLAQPFSIVAYLGHIISIKGIKPDKAELTAITTYPIPQNTKEVSSWRFQVTKDVLFLLMLTRVGACSFTVVRAKARLEYNLMMCHGTSLQFLWSLGIHSYIAT